MRINANIVRSQIRNVLTLSRRLDGLFASLLPWCLFSAALFNSLDLATTQAGTSDGAVELDPFVATHLGAFLVVAKTAGSLAALAIAAFVMRRKVPAWRGAIGFAGLGFSAVFGVATVGNLVVIYLIR